MQLHPVGEAGPSAVPARHIRVARVEPIDLADRQATSDDAASRHAGVKPDLDPVE
jgi:hypothetical protein